MPSPTGSSRAEIEVEQLARLRQLIGRILGGNRFYTETLSETGIDDAIESLHAFSRRMPFTTKQQLIDDQLAHPPFGTNLTYPIDRYTRFHQTSGTTRAPLRWLDTSESWACLLDDWARVYRAAGVVAGDRVYFAFSFGPFIGFWMAFEAAAALGCLCIPGGGLTSAARLGAILEYGATVLCCTPTYALRLVEVAEAEGLDLTRSKVRTIIVAGEPGGSLPATRERITRGWSGARVFDHHGMTEVGPVTYECPDRPCSLRVIESSYYAEIVDQRTGEAIGDDRVGELVLTTLRRAGSPLLRYRTGDLVRRGEPGPAGELTLEGGILGRVDDMLVVRGANVYPSAVDQIVRSLDGVREYRVEYQTTASMTELTVKIEVDKDTGDAETVSKSLEESLRTALSLRIPVRVVPPGSLPRCEMKGRRWVKVS